MTIYLDYAADHAGGSARRGGHGRVPDQPTHGQPGVRDAWARALRRPIGSRRRAAKVAALIGATPREIIFTSGATEANNLALLGVARAARRAGAARGHVVSSRTEHKSVLDACKQLEKEGFAVTLLEPDDTGRVPPETVSADAARRHAARLR